MILVSVILSRFAGRSSRIAKSLFAALFVLASSVLTIESLPSASALAATPTVTAPSSSAFNKNVANQDSGDFIITNFGADDPLLVSVDLVNPPTGTSFVLPTTAGLTAGYGYNFTGNKTQISFTGKQADANTALAAMTVTTGSNNAGVEIRVSVSRAIANVYFNPVNGHYYEFVSDAATTDCKVGADATCITNIEDAIASKTLFGAQGYWATITSAQENTFIANKMDAPNIAIGLSDRETEGTWRWLHGPEKGAASFLNWAENEPNDYNPCEDGDPNCFPGEDYVVTNWSEVLGFWNDYGRPHFGDELSYVVEYSSDCYSVSSGNCVSGTFPASSQASASVTSTVGWGLARPAAFAEAVQSSSPETSFASVSCASPGNCTAVGEFNNSDGSREAFTMTSTNSAWALAQPAEFADGIQNDPANATFTAVSCATAGNCTAVGRFENSNNRDEVFTMTSTNGVWELAQPAAFADGVQNDNPDSIFSSVSCASPGKCTAVGRFRNSVGSHEAFTMTSTNGVWELARPAVFADGVQSNLFPIVEFKSVSCATAGNCTAVGTITNSSLIEESFTMTSTNNEWGHARPAVFETGIQSQSRYSNFSSVSCASPGNCTAVGRFENSNNNQFEAFTMSLTNSGWDLARRVVFNSDTQSLSPNGTLASVSCASPGNCTAAGLFKNSTDDFEAFTLMSANGIWGKAEPASFPAGIQSDPSFAVFTSVSCASPGNCTAVGEFANSSNELEAFTTSMVNETPSPPDEGWDLARPAEFPNGLFGFSELIASSISCSSPGNCTVVGGFQHLITTYGFHAFTITSTNGAWGLARAAVFPNGVQRGFNAFTVLKSVSCASPGNCTAVGSFVNSDDAREAFTMTSTNGAWELARPAVFADGVQSEDPNGILNSVSCTSPGNCTAVGNFRNLEGSREAFTMTSTNGAWELARPAVFASGIQPNSPIARFTSVSCATAGNCTAIGSFANLDDFDEAFTMTSTNGVWALARPVEFPDGVQSEDPNGILNSVSCTSPGNCTIVGRFRTSDGSHEAFTMTSTNTVWELARPAIFPETAGPFRTVTEFASVSCTSPGNCTAAGTFGMVSGGNAAFTMTSTNGVWELARPAIFPIGAQSATPNSSSISVSCPSATSCTAAGDFIMSDANSGAGGLFTMSLVENTPPSTTTTTTTTPTTTTTTTTTTTVSPTTTTIASPTTTDMSTSTTVSPATTTTIASPSSTVASTTTTVNPAMSTAAAPKSTSSTTPVVTSMSAVQQLFDKLPTTGTNPRTTFYAIWLLTAGLILTYRRKRQQR